MGLTIEEFFCWMPDCWQFDGQVEIRDVCFGNRTIFAGTWTDIPGYLKLRECSVVCRRFHDYNGDYDLIFYV